MAEELTFNEQLRDAMVSHQIGLLLFSGNVRNRIWELLDATEADIRQQITERLRRDAGKPLTPARLLRVEKLLETLHETRLGGWKQANAVWFEEMSALAIEEPKFIVNIIHATFPVELALELPDPERLRAIVKSKPFMGATLKEWASDIARTDLQRIDQQIKIGLTQGEHPRQIARRIVGTVALRGADGVTAITRRQAESITRTATNAIASEARRELYADNADLIDEEVFTATLDSRTTPICRSLDGKRYKTDDPAKPVLPLHWGERSLLLPVIDGQVIGERPMRNFTERQLLREYARQEGFEAPKRRDGLPHGTRGAFDEFARKRMRELTGTTPAKTTYGDWLKRQPAAMQDDILGSTRGALFRRGGLKLDRFVTPEGRTLTLDELAEREASAFRRAGFDPKEFANN